MQRFGTNEYGDRDGFTITCNKCGKEARLVPRHIYEDYDFKNPVKIKLEFRCICDNRYGADIHNR